MKKLLSLYLILHLNVYLTIIHSWNIIFLAIHIIPIQAAVFNVTDSLKSVFLKLPEEKALEPLGNWSKKALYDGDGRKITQSTNRKN